MLEVSEGLVDLGLTETVLEVVPYVLAFESRDQGPETLQFAVENSCGRLKLVDSSRGRAGWCAIGMCG
jgi:hypothetical protein